MIIFTYRIKSIKHVVLYFSSEGQKNNDWKKGKMVIGTDPY